MAQAQADDPRPDAPVFASSLQKAERGSLLQLDHSGQVVPPRYQVLAHAQALAVMGAAVAVWYVFIGPFALLGAAAMGLIYGRNQIVRRRLNRVATLVGAQQLDEAESQARALRDGALVPRGHRAYAARHLATIAMWRGQFADVVTHTDHALRLYRGHPLFVAQVRYTRVIALINLERLPDARKELERQRILPGEGDYLRTVRWTAELYLWMAEGAHPLDLDQLHERARVALGMTLGATLLGLTAWAHAQRQSHDQAWHLLRESLDRRQERGMARVMPRLHAWIEAHAAEARAAVDPAGTPRSL
jgi:hypothetical protein